MLGGLHRHGGNAEQELELIENDEDLQNSEENKED